MAVNGKYPAIDLHDEAQFLPFLARVLQYIISSHMWEHVYNPIAALLEWNRVLMHGGIVFMIVPLPDAHAPDKGRTLTTWEEWVEAYKEDWTPDTVPEQVNKAAGGHRGHYFVYSPETLKALIAKACEQYGLNWELIAEENPDTKVGNGFTIVYRVKHPDGNLPISSGRSVEQTNYMKANYSLPPSVVVEPILPKPTVPPAPAPVPATPERYVPVEEFPHNSGSKPRPRSQRRCNNSQRKNHRTRTTRKRVNSETPTRKFVGLIAVARGHHGC